MCAADWTKWQHDHLYHIGNRDPGLKDGAHKMSDHHRQLLAGMAVHDAQEQEDKLECVITLTLSWSISVAS
jgi:hypothetical protein